jgi:hypothetical protein
LLQDTEPTSSPTKCDEDGHIAKILNWTVDQNDPQRIMRAGMYGCTRCDATSEVLWEGFGEVNTKSNCAETASCMCFKCRARSVQMNAGDAKGAIVAGGMTQKKWDKELDAYRAARKQGIQPDSTRTKDINKAVELSNKHGKAYDGGSPTKGLA